MKKTITLLAAIAIGQFGFAQEEMAQTWETKCDHPIQFATGFTSSKGYTYGSSQKTITIVDNKTGQIKWSKKFDDMAKKLGKVDEIVPLWDANALFLFDRKMGKDQMACIDVQSGEAMWTSDKYQDVGEDNVIYIPEIEAFALSLEKGLVMIKARTGEEIWQTSKLKGFVGSYTYMSDGHLVILNLMPTRGRLRDIFKGFKNQILKIDVKNGDVVWDADFLGVVERKVVTRQPVVKMKIDNGKIFLELNGVQVYDYKTGTKIWSCAYDMNISNIVKAPANAVAWGVYGGVAEPLIVGRDVYVIDMQSRKKQFIKKFDLNSGKLLWTSPELYDVKVAPGLYLEGDKLVLQVGGVVETQAIIEKCTTDPNTHITTCDRYTKIDFPNIKPWRLMCFDANNGKQLWESEKFKKGITNAYLLDGKIIACSGKAIYNMDIADGKENYEILLKADKIGKATKIIPYKDRVIIVGQKGISEHKPADGSLLMSGKYKTSMLESVEGNILLMKTPKSDIAAFDLETCKFKKFNARKGATTYLSDEGDFVVVCEKKTITRLSTK